MNVAVRFGGCQELFRKANTGWQKRSDRHISDEESIVPFLVVFSERISDKLFGILQIVVLKVNVQYKVLKSKDVSIPHQTRLTCANAARLTVRTQRRSRLPLRIS